MSPSGDLVGSEEPVVAFRGVSKRFGGTLAVDNVDLDVRQGEIHALLGANGAGKSTLIKLLAGIHQPDTGEILLKGRPSAALQAIDLRSPSSTRTWACSPGRQSLKILLSFADIQSAGG